VVHLRTRTVPAVMLAAALDHAVSAMAIDGAAITNAARAAST